MVKNVRAFRSEFQCLSLFHLEQTRETCVQGPGSGAIDGAGIQIAERTGMGSLKAAGLSQKQVKPLDFVRSSVHWFPLVFDAVWSAYCVSAFFPFSARSVPLYTVNALPDVALNAPESRQLPATAFIHVPVNFGMLMMPVALTRCRISDT